MPNYRRRYTGQHVFLTAVSAGRRPIFSNTHARDLLRDAIEATRNDRPWKTTAMVLLPDHFHVIMELPEGDLDYSSRVAAMKKRFTRAWLAAGGTEAPVPPGQQKKRLRGVWQQRFWEHTIRDARDYSLHVDYIHTNPVKHGHADAPKDWPWSTFHDYVKRGIYDEDWCGRIELPGNTEYVWPE